jgi:hypothetical protein
LKISLYYAQGIASRDLKRYLQADEGYDVSNFTKQSEQEVDQLKKLKNLSDRERPSHKQNETQTLNLSAIAAPSC